MKKQKPLSIRKKMLSWVFRYRGLIGGGVVCCVIIGLAVSPLFHPGLFPTIDNISVVRLEAMADELRSGQFPVRWVERLGREHGYMLFGYYAPLPFYVGALIHILNVNLVGALKRSYLLAFLLGSGGIFGLSNEFFGVFGAIISVAAYAFSPFVGYDVYWRGGLGEVWAMGFVPWVLWFSYRAIRNRSRRDAVASAISLVGLVLSHNLTAYMGIGFIALWMLAWVCRQKRGLGTAFAIGGAGLALSSFFWLPAFANRGLVWVSYLQADKAKVFEGLLQGNVKEIFFPTFIPMITNWTALVLPFLGWWMVRTRVQEPVTRYAASVLGGLVVLALFLVSGFSRPIWDVLYRVLYIFQFPWRFLTMLTIFGSVLAGGCVYVLRHKRWLIALALSSVILAVNVPNYRPRTYEFIPKYEPQDPCGTSWGFEYLPIWVKTCLKTSWKEPYRVVSGDAVVQIQKQASRSLSFATKGSKESVVEIGWYDYPGWQATIDGKFAPITHVNDNGLIELTIPSGNHAARVELRATPIERWSTVLSVAAACALGVTLLWEVVGTCCKRAHPRKKGIIGKA